MTDPQNTEQELEAVLNQEIHEAAQKIAEEKAFEEGPLLPVEARVKKHEHELSQYVQYAKRRCNEGFHLCHDAVCMLAQTDTTIDLQALDANIKEAFSRFDETVHVLEMSNKASEGTSWKDLLGLKENTMQHLYTGAKKLFEGGRYPEAEAAFFFLTTVDFSQYAFWLGLGHAAFRFGKHQSGNKCV
jgi:superoxide dismutase